MADYHVALSSSKICKGNSEQIDIPVIRKHGYGTIILKYYCKILHMNINLYYKLLVTHKNYLSIQLLNAGIDSYVIFST